MHSNAPKRVSKMSQSPPPRSQPFRCKILKSFELICCINFQVSIFPLHINSKFAKCKLIWARPIYWQTLKYSLENSFFDHRFVNFEINSLFQLDNDGKFWCLLINDKEKFGVWVGNFVGKIELVAARWTNNAWKAVDELVVSWNL